MCVCVIERQTDQPVEISLLTQQIREVRDQGVEHIGGKSAKGEFAFPINRTANGDLGAALMPDLSPCKDTLKGCLELLPPKLAELMQNSAQDHLEPFDCTGNAGMGKKTLEPHQNSPT